MALTIIPTSRPKYAPIAIDGTKIPAGTLAPYETMTSKIRMTVARNSEFTIAHWAEVLARKFIIDVRCERGG
jgi:predicted 2-oxoglutarate/Fe(II)-dependent dioxygenase YbiX